ncbi:MULTISPECIES: DNA-3-methyladenine glycosylase I [unclassified Dietzia]|uniref:DNA-3-methyladenine glycosylase I n=1 Tax=unclassified Dietzia TaxID=2617939 RepID=UPI000D20348D|nr:MULTISPECIES: DNA-3-methyladenine glycosylase I [unclassified Dietzia]AVZ40574.1 3-methyladenine DNA glycosylase [Dietzia sp. JS16-p6b]
MTIDQVYRADGAVRCEDGLMRPPWAARDPLLREYYDTEWGMPVHDEAGLFERLVLEGFQSGLSWLTILRKRPAFREAFAGFSPDAVAEFGDADVARLMADERIVRNRRKIDAAVGNARAVISLRAEGGLGELIWSYRPETTPEPRTMSEVPSRSPESEALARELKRRGFSFVGPVTVFALMEAIGVVDTHLVSSHRRGTSGIWSSGGLPGITPGGRVQPGGPG